MFENPRRGRQARNFTANVPKILVLKSSSEQIFSRKLPLGAPDMLPMMASLRILQFSTVCRWGTEQPQSSFGLIFILFPMKIAGGHHHGSQGKSPPPANGP